jgi:hypothetical protein
MARDWLVVMTANFQAWGIPAGVLSDFQALINGANNALTTALNETTRTPVANALCKEAFDALTACMRDIKRRYFLCPPLTEADLISLGLKPRSPGSPIPEPESQAEAQITFPGIHLVELSHIGPIGGFSGDLRSYYGTRIFFGFAGVSASPYDFRLSTPPIRGNQLPYSAFTRRQRHRFDWDGESGNTVYICLHYENETGKPGPFGPIMQAIIP